MKTEEAINAETQRGGAAEKTPERQESGDWVNRFIRELDEKQRAVEATALLAPNAGARGFGMALASIFEGVKKCAIRAAAPKAEQ